MYRFLTILCLLLVGASVSPNACLERWYTSQIGVREATGHNDGPVVESYLKNVGLGKGYSWCSAFVKTGLIHCGIKNNINGWAPTAVSSINVVFQNGSFIAQPEPGDVCGIYSFTQRRIIHVFFFNRKKNSSIETVEGNTNDNGSSNGDGVYRRVRPLYSINKIVRWL